MKPISAVIITFNEAQKITRCLNSVRKVADEIIVIDSFSTDNTLTICQQFNVRVEQREWEGYASAKNYGNRIAQHDFILSIDADEVLSPELISSILTEKPRLSGAYSMNRLTNYCGSWIYHCGWYPDTKIRLFNRQDARWAGDYVHEALEFSRPVDITRLNGDLWHYSFDSLGDHIQRVNQYSDLAAQELVASGKGGYWGKMLISPGVKFVQSYLFRRGILDGFYGFCISAISAFDIFIRYAKAVQLKRAARREDT